MGNLAKKLLRSLIDLYRNILMRLDLYRVQIEIFSDRRKVLLSASSRHKDRFLGKVAIKLFLLLAKVRIVELINVDTDDIPPPAAYAVTQGSLLPASKRASYRDIPIALIILQNLNDQEAKEVLGDIAKIQVTHAHFRPVFVVYSSDFSAIRRYRYSFEYIMDDKQWNGFGSDLEWEDYNAIRMKEILRCYQPQTVIRITSQDISDGGLSSALLPLSSRLQKKKSILLKR